MIEESRIALAMISRLLEYPDAEFFSAIPQFRVELEQNFNEGNGAQIRDLITNFLDKLESQGQEKAGEDYVSIFDHDPGASLHMTWHRYGNDRSQGKAMAALNGLYRTAGFEPLPGSMPDYVPRMLEFLAVCEDWAAEAVLDGFGPEMATLEEVLKNHDCPQASIFSLALDPLRKSFPDKFIPRIGKDPTARLMARPEPELIPLELTMRKTN